MDAGEVSEISCDVAPHFFLLLLFTKVPFVLKTETACSGDADYIGVWAKGLSIYPAIELL